MYKYNLIVTNVRKILAFVLNVLMAILVMNLAAAVVTPLLGVFTVQITPLSVKFVVMVINTVKELSAVLKTSINAKPVMMLQKLAPLAMMVTK